MLAKHKVKDYAAWKLVFDRLADFRKASGEISFLILSQPQDPNSLTLLFEWDKPENAESFTNSDKLKNVMQEGGVVGEPQIEFLNEVDQGTL